MQEVVPALRARGHQRRDRQGLRVRSRPLRRAHAKESPASGHRASISGSSLVDAIDPMLLDGRTTSRRTARSPRVVRVLREALKGKAGVGTVAMHGRERLVAVEPRDALLVMFTLRHENEIRQPDSIEETHDLSRKVRPEEVALAKKVIGEFESTIDFSKYHDTYEDALRKMIDAKIRGEDVITTEEEAPPKVVNLMDALRKSLDQVGRGKTRPAKRGRGREAAEGSQVPEAKGRLAGSEVPEFRGSGTLELMSLASWSLTAKYSATVASTKHTAPATSQRPCVVTSSTISGGSVGRRHEAIPENAPPNHCSASWNQVTVAPKMAPATPTAAARPTACATVIGRTAARAASARAAICARHQIRPASGSCALARASSKSSSNTGATATTSAQMAQPATCARSSGSDAIGPAAGVDRGQHVGFERAFDAAHDATALEQAGEPAARAEQQELDAARLHAERVGDLAVRRALRRTRATTSRARAA